MSVNRLAAGAGERSEARSTVVDGRGLYSGISQMAPPVAADGSTTGGATADDRPKKPLTPEPKTTIALANP